MKKNSVFVGSAGSGPEGGLRGAQIQNQQPESPEPQRAAGHPVSEVQDPPDNPPRIYMNPDPGTGSVTGFYRFCYSLRFCQGVVQVLLFSLAGSCRRTHLIGCRGSGAQVYLSDQSTASRKCSPSRRSVMSLPVVLCVFLFCEDC